MLDKIMFMTLFSITTISYIGLWQEFVFDGYQIISAILMFYLMYLGTYQKKAPNIVVFTIVANTIIAGSLGVYEELNNNLYLMSETELATYISFILAYYGISIHLILKART